MVTIRKKREADGYYYEIDDFNSYVQVLRQRGIDPPQAKYRIFISSENELLIHQTVADWEAQIAMFFKLGSAVDYTIVSE